MFPPLFLVPKKDGGQRPDINLKSLNSFVDTPHFKMEGIHTLKSLVLEGDWLVKVDLKDAYFSVPISQKHRKFLCFQFEDKSYQFNCLPFGLASAPWVFTKTLKPVAALGRELGIRMVVYIDDILLMAEIKEKARDQASSLIYLVTVPGFHSKHGEDSVRTLAMPRVPGFHGRHHQDGAKSTSSEDNKDSGGVPTVVRGGAGYSPCPLQINWQDECHESGDPTGTPVLQEPTNGPGNSSERSGPGLRDSSRSIPRQPGGADLEGHPNDKMEWQDGDDNGAKPDHRIGCLNPGLGSVPSRHQHWGGPGPPRRRNGT